MNIQTELSRIINAKAAIKTAIEGKGVTVPDATLLDGMASLIESIKTGGDFYLGRFTPLNPTETISLIWNNIPDVIVIVGPVSGASPNTVGLAIHIKDANGGVYQEKWRYQSTKYLIGTSATDGSLFTLSEYANNDGFSITINSGESSYGKYFSGIEYKIFAAKLY